MDLHALAQALEMELPRLAHVYARNNARYYTRRMHPDHFAAAVCAKYTLLPAWRLLEAYARAGGAPLSEKTLAACALSLGHTLPLGHKCPQMVPQSPGPCARAWGPARRAAAAGTA